METIGPLLKHAREAKKMSLEDVSKATKISTRILNALEAEDFSILPSEIYARAFVKKYSGFLGVAAPVLEQYSKAHPAVAAPSPILRPNIPLPPLNATQRKILIKKTWLKGIGIFAVVTAIAVAGVWLKRAGKAAVPKDEVLMVAGIQDAQKEPAERPPEATRAAVFSPVSAQQGLILEILALDKVWLRIKADNLLLFEGTLAKNDKESWQAQREFVLRIGSAGSAKLLLNGQELGAVGNKGEVKTVVISKDGIVKTR